MRQRSAALIQSSVPLSGCGRRAGGLVWHSSLAECFADHTCAISWTLPGPSPAKVCMDLPKNATW